jgi:hypothetical protein
MASVPSVVRRATGVEESGASAWEVLLRTALLVTVLAAAGGAVTGFALGVSYLPTLPFAVVEAAVLASFPGALLGLVVGTFVVLVRHVRRTS